MGRILEYLAFFSKFWGMNGYPQILDKYHNKIIFSGNVDQSVVIANGTPVMVGQKTTELPELYKDSPRFIINAGCEIPSTAPEKDIRNYLMQ